MSASASLLLLNNASVTGPWMDWIGGISVFSVAGTFGGATVQLNMLGADGTTAIQVSSTQSTFLAAGAGAVHLPPCRVQAQVIGGAPSGLYATLVREVS